MTSLLGAAPAKQQHGRSRIWYLCMDLPLLPVVQKLGSGKGWGWVGVGGGVIVSSFKIVTMCSQY